MGSRSAPQRERVLFRHSLMIGVGGRTGMDRYLGHDPTEYWLYL